MQIESLYAGKTESKTGQIIPLTKNNRTIESKYNPERDALKLLESITEDYNFFVVLGVGSGFFLSTLSKKYPDARIIAIENTKQDIDFLLTFPQVKLLSENKNIQLIEIIDLKKTIISSYIPALYGNLKIIEIMPWMNENNTYISFIQSEISQALSIISADFSVQAHFGKIWQKNILNNIKHLNHSISIFSEKKVCAVIAAGPTLDEKIKYLKENQKDIFIISTDTAYSSLLKHHITPEIVVSIDGQFISHSHFLHKNHNNTIFAFDLCSDSTAVNHIPDKQILFFVSGHPLSSLVNSNLSNSILDLYTGAGTVTISSLDLAQKLGFSDIQVIGADFSYRNGKPYTRGTYLDVIYGNSETKITTSEHQFSKLQFRTELLPVSDKIKTTSVLESYKKSFLEYIQAINYSYKYENNIYYLHGNNKGTVNYKQNYSFNLQNFFNYSEKQYQSNNIAFLLPYISYLRNKNTTMPFDNMLNLAHSVFVSYNEVYEKK